jgi:ferredoxin-type protein NapH
MACPLGVLVNFSRLQIVPFITLGILGLVGTLGGRFVCGWVCPFGLLQDLLHKIPGRKLRLPAKLSYVKYAVLVIFVLAVPHLWPTRPLTFCDGCPSGVLESTIPWAFAAHWKVTPGMFSGFTPRFMIRGGITLFVILFSILASRGFCRVFCPLGAIFALFNRFSLFRFNLAHKECNSCTACAKVCPVEIDPVKEMNSAECIRCYECTLRKHIKMGAK